MSRVVVKYRGHLVSLTGVKEESFDAADIKGLLNSLKSRYSREAEKAARSMLITVNGESIHLLRHYKTTLQGGDVIGFFPICAGG